MPGSRRLMGVYRFIGGSIGILELCCMSLELIEGFSDSTQSLFGCFGLRGLFRGFIETD